MQTRLTEMLGIEHPVMLAGMGGVSYHVLVAAVSDAGGFGTLGAATMQSDELDMEMAAVKAATDKPFGVDLLAALPERMLADAHKVVSGGASLFVAGLGVPRDVVKLLHDGNVLVASMCGKVRHAVAAVEAGCDFVIAQGTEAGGHTGTVATMPLVPQIVDEVGARVPVVAAGGIFDGRGLAAAISLGGDEFSDVDPDKECYPSGQGVGAIHDLVPAGDLVRRIVDEAEHALARAASTVVR